MSFLETAKETVEMHANQLRYQAGSIGVFRTEDARLGKELLAKVANVMLLELVDNVMLLELKEYDKDALQRYVQRARAYLNEMEELISDNDWTEVIHHLGHVEQEMQELEEEIKSNEK